MTKHIIWSNRDLNINDWKEDILEAEPNLDEHQISSRVSDINYEFLNDVRDNLNIQFPQPIIIIGDLGLWSGRVLGYKFINSGNIRDCLYDDLDYVEWFVDGRLNLRADAYHHDGTNHYLYRVFKDGLSDCQINHFLEQIYQNKITSQDISRFTRRIGGLIAKFYGWN